MLRVRAPRIALVAGGGVVAADGSAVGTSTVDAVGAKVQSGDAVAAGTSTVSAVGSTGGAVVAADASAVGTSTVAAVGAKTQAADATAVGSSTVDAASARVQAADANAVGSSTVNAVTPSVAATSASATGQSIVSAEARVVGGAASVPQKFARWASYQRKPGSFLRQVSPGVYLRAGTDEPPVVVVNDRELGPAADLRGDRLAGMLAQGLDRRDARKIRKILRRLDEPPAAVEVEPPKAPTPPKSAEAQKLIEEVNASTSRRYTIRSEAIDEEIAVLVALGIV